MPKTCYATRTKSAAWQSIPAGAVPLILANSGRALSWEDVFPSALNSCLRWAMDQQHQMGARLHGWRQAVSRDVRDLVLEVREDQEEWLALAPQHVQRVIDRLRDSLWFCS